MYEMTEKMYKMKDGFLVCNTNFAQIEFVNVIAAVLFLITRANLY